ncbi:MAG TPA: Ig-like domain-containing protein, partial [Anaerolineae bacterium]|nr:Ig-like domain-containing protein [Anaerolineae bacterium]
MFKGMVRQFSKPLSLLVVLILLLSACDVGVPKATPTSGEPTMTPLPTETPLPTATPLPLPAPRLLYRSPAPGEEQPLDAPIELTFDQPMDRASVEAAFVISPTLEGKFSWTDERVASFAAVEGLERGVRYQVTVSEQARNVEGMRLEEPEEFQFSAVGYLAVSEVMPMPGSEELDPDTTVTVIFNRPVVPLTTISQQDQLPDPLTFVPPVQGQGEWLNTSIYLFRPET